MEQSKILKEKGALKMPRIRSPYNFVLTFDDIEHPSGPKMVVPDMSLKISEILDRFTAGTLGAIGKDGQYEDNPDFDDYDETRAPDFDLSDVTRIRSELAENQRVTDERNTAKAKEKEAAEAKEKEDFEKFKSERGKEAAKSAVADQTTKGSGSDVADEARPSA